MSLIQFKSPFEVGIVNKFALPLFQPGDSYLSNSSSLNALIIAGSRSNFKNRFSNEDLFNFSPSLVEKSNGF